MKKTTPALLLGLAMEKSKGKPRKPDDADTDTDTDDEAPSTERETDHDAAFREAADEAFEAIEAGDKRAFREALQAAIYACQEE